MTKTQRGNTKTLHAIKKQTNRKKKLTPPTRQKKGKRERKKKKKRKKHKQKDFWSSERSEGPSRTGDAIFWRTSPEQVGSPHKLPYTSVRSEPRS